jgi:hypothetical protein
MSLRKSKCWYSDNCLHFFKRDIQLQNCFLKGKRKTTLSWRRKGKEEGRGKRGDKERKKERNMRGRDGGNNEGVREREIKCMRVCVCERDRERKCVR